MRPSFQTLASKKYYAISKFDPKNKTNNYSKVAKIMKSKYVSENIRFILSH